MLKHIGLTFIQLVKWAFLLPQTIVSALQQRRLNVDSDQREAERLDRIRNPDKYLGK